MADGLNMTTAELRKLAGEGGITPEKALEGLEKGAANIDRQFSQLTKTIDQGLTNVSTAWTRVVGETSNSVYASQRLFKLLDETVAQSLNSFAQSPENIKALAETIQFVLGGALLLGVAHFSKWVVGAIAATGATTRKEVANYKLAQSEVAVARANLATITSNNALLATTTSTTAAVNALAVAEGRLAVVTGSLTPLSLALASTTGVLSKAMVTATTVARGLWAAIGGPIGLIAILGTLAYTYFSTGESAVDSFEKQAKAAEDARVKILRDTRAILEAQQLNPDNLQASSYASLVAARTNLIKKDEEAQRNVLTARADTERATIALADAEKQLNEVLAQGSAGPRGSGSQARRAQQSEAQARVNAAKEALNAAKQVEASATSTRDSLQKAEEQVTGALGGSRFVPIKQLEDLTKGLGDQLERVDEGGDIVQKTLKEIDKARKGLNTTDPTAVAEFDKQAAAALANAKAIEARKKAISEAAKAERKSIREGEALAKRQAKYLVSLEKEQASLNVSSTEKRIIDRQLDFEEQKLTGTTRERAKAIIELLNQRDRETQQAENAKENTSLEIEYLRLLGKEREATQQELSAWLAQTQKKMQTEGNAIGVALAKSIFNTKTLKAEADKAVNDAVKSLDSFYVRERQIETERVKGNLSIGQSADALVASHKEEADIIEQQIIPALEKQAALGLEGSEDAKKRIADYKLQVAEFRAELGYLESAFKTGFTEGLNEAVQGLADGTMSLREATLSLINSISTNLLQAVTTDLSDQLYNSFKQSDFASSLSGAFSSLTSLFGGSGGATSAVTGTMGATQLTASATALTTSSGTLTTAGISLQTAAAALTTAATALAGSGATSGLASGLGGGGSSGFFSSLSGLFGGGGTGGGGGSEGDIIKQIAMMFATGAATGGHITGQGTETSDSIPTWLSNNEFVVRAASVKQSGALSFLHDFNRNGMSALDRWHHSTGGLAGTPAPQVSANRSIGTTSLPEADNKSSTTTLKNSQNFFLVDDPSRISEIVGSKGGADAIAVAISRNPAKFKNILGIK